MRMRAVVIDFYMTLFSFKPIALFFSHTSSIVKHPNKFIFLTLYNICKSFIFFFFFRLGGQTMTLSHLDRKMYMLGYVGRENRVYLCDKQMNVTSYVLLTSILEYQTWVLRGNFEEANTILNSGSIPKEENNKISRFLESQG